MEMPGDLQAATHDLREQGFCVLRGIVQPAHLELIEAKMSLTLPELMVAHEQRWGWPAFQWRYGHLQQDPPRGSQWVFGDVLANQSVAQVAKAVLGDGCWITGLTGNTNMLGSRPQPVHRDRDHDSTPHHCLVCNIPTQDVSATLGNGPIEVWRASHIEHKTTKLVESVRAGNEVHMITGALSDEQLRGTVHPALVEQRRLVAPPVHVDMRQGDVLIRDARLWHSGTPNTVSPRYMLTIVISADASPVATGTASSGPVFDVGCGSEHEIAPENRKPLDIGPSVRFVPDRIIEAESTRAFTARDRSTLYDSSGPLLPTRIGGAPRL
jgi:hypothetical protein